MTLQLLTPELLRLCNKAFKTIFPQSYPAVHDNTGFCVDETDAKYYDTSLPVITIESLIRNMTLYLKDYRGYKHYKKHLNLFAEDTGIRLSYNNFLCVYEWYGFDEINNGIINWGKMTNSIIIISENVNNSQYINHQYQPNIQYILELEDSINRNNSSSDIQHLKCNLSPKSRTSNRTSDLNVINSNCQLFREFASNSRKLSYDELFSMATNINKVETGIKRFMQILVDSTYFSSNNKKYRDWAFYLAYLKTHPAKPCDLFCPYKDICQHAKDIISAVRPKRNEVIMLSNSENADSNNKLPSIDIAEKDFRKKFTMAIAANDKKIHVLNAPIGIGKSTAVLDYMEITTHKCLFAFPTNDLKNELYEKAIYQGIQAVKSPSLLESKDELPVNIWNRIEVLYQSGKTALCQAILKKSLPGVRSISAKQIR